MSEPDVQEHEINYAVNDRPGDIGRRLLKGFIRTRVVIVMLNIERTYSAARNTFCDAV